MTDEIDNRPTPPPEAYEDENKIVQIKDYIQAGVAYGALRVMSDIDATQAPPREYYLKNLISPAEMSVIYGEPGCGKSFWIVYISRAISQGREVLGKRVHQTNVLFMALEGAHGFQKRLRAEILKNKESEGFYYVAQPVNLFSDHKALQDVIAATQGCGAGVVVIDTLNRALAGGSENAPEDMGKFIQNIDAIRAATGAHVIIIHHSGKDSTRGMRGHSALLGAADVAIEVARDRESKTRTATVVKAKDDADGDTFAFQLDVQELGLDQDGDPITTCLVREAAPPEKPASKTTKKSDLTPDEWLWLDTIQELFARDESIKVVRPERNMKPVPCANRDTVREWIKLRGLVGISHQTAGPGILTDKDRKLFGRMLTSLKCKNKIGVHGDWIWLIVTRVT